MSAEQHTTKPELTFAERDKLRIRRTNNAWNSIERQNIKDGDIVELVIAKKEGDAHTDAPLRGAVLLRFTNIGNTDRKMIAYILVDGNRIRPRNVHSIKKIEG